MMTRSKEQKAAYYKTLRARWSEAKAQGENEQLKYLFNTSGLTTVSYYSFVFTMIQMQKLGYDGLPYVDCKTFNGWKDNGFKVKKGEKSQIQGIVWINSYTKKEADESGNKSEVLVTLDHSYPKLYYLFHKSQVEPA